MARSTLSFIVASIAFALIVVAASPEAEARPRPAGGGGGSDFRANKEFGLGFMLGNPTAFAGKYYLSDDTALDFGVGYSRHYGRSRDYAGLHLHASFLWHPVVLARPDPFWMPLYFGVGGRFLDRDYFYDRRYRSRLGVRVPGGIMLDFNNVPIDIFGELAFTFDFVSPGHRRFFWLDGAVGLRYYFQ